MARSRRVTAPPGQRILFLGQSDPAQECGDRGEGYGFDARTVDATADLGYDDQPGAKIRFAVGKGFQVQPQTTVTDVATAVAAGVGGFTQQGGAHSVIRNLALVGAGTGASVAGFYSRILVHLENVHVLKFQGKGFDLSASGTTPDGNSEYGAVNGATLRNCRAVYNGSHGFHIRGTDANACTFINCTAQLNGGWGFLDESALGNTYVGGEAATNTSGSYKCIGSVAVSNYYGCYAETGTGRAPDLSSQCLVSGGVLSGAASSVNVGSNGNPTNIVSTGISSPQLNFSAAQNEAVASATNAKVFRGANSGLILQGAPNGGGTFDVSIFNKNAALVVGISTGTLQTRLFGETAIDFNGLFFNGPSTWAGAFGSDGSARVFSTAAGGLQLYGQGSSYDVSLGNKVGTIALRVPTNTTNVQVVGSLSVGGVTVFNGSGVLQAAAFPALTGDVTTSAGALASTIAANVVTYAKFQQVAASSLVGNPTGSLANAQAITLAGGLAFSGTTLTAAGALTPTSVASTGAVTSSSATAGIGYASGSRGTQTQATSKATGVTSNTVVTDITLNGAALAASTTVSFVFTNSAIAANDTLTLNHVTTGTFGSYTLNAHGFGAGSCTIDVRNVSLGSLSEAIVIRAVLVKGG
jgi:hypothetical protein